MFTCTLPGSSPLGERRRSQQGVSDHFKIAACSGHCQGVCRSVSGGGFGEGLTTEDTESTEEKQEG